ncbi:protealysin inhibitor emfourin [Microbacterium sp. NPDC091313]
MDHAESERDQAHPLIVTVVRSGGIGGMRRQWRVEPATSESARWRALLSSCPWDDPPAQGAGADRFVWRICADDDASRHEADVPDSALHGAWRELVDAVRAAASEVSRTAPPASS